MDRKRFTRKSVRALRFVAGALTALAASGMLLYAVWDLSRLPPSPQGKSYVSLILHGQSVVRPPLSAQLDLALMVGSASLLAVLGLAWIMTATQQQIRLATSSSSDDRSLYRLVLDLHERIGRLEAEIRELRGQQPSEPTRIAPLAAPSAQGRPQQATSPLDVASQYALSNTRTPARAAKPYDRSAFDSAPDEDIYSDPAPPAQPAHASVSTYAIETHGRGEFYNGVMHDYDRALGGAIAKFEQNYQPSPAELTPNGGVRISDTPDMAPFWFVPIAQDLGLLLPSGTAMRQWSEMFQYLGGKPARQTFGIAYEVEKGDSLDVVQPAWAELSGDSVQIGRKGVLKGA